MVEVLAIRRCESPPILGDLDPSEPHPKYLRAAPTTLIGEELNRPGESGDFLV